MQHEMLGPYAEQERVQQLMAVKMEVQGVPLADTATTAVTAAEETETVAGQAADGVAEERTERGPSFMALFDSGSAGNGKPGAAAADEAGAGGGRTIDGGDATTPAAVQEPLNGAAIPTSSLLSETRIPTIVPPAFPAPTVPASATLPLRTRSSCTNCRQRKQRCDHGPPGHPCKACTKSGKVCVYPGGIVLGPGTGIGQAATAGAAAQEVGKSKRKKSSAALSASTGDVSDGTSPRVPCSHIVMTRATPAATKERTLRPQQRGNREFTDSDDDDDDDDSAHHSSSSDGDDPRRRSHKRELPSSRAPVAQGEPRFSSSRRVNGIAGKGQGDEVDELDDDGPALSSDEPTSQHPAPPPQAAQSSSSRYISYSINLQTAPREDFANARKPPLKPSRTFSEDEDDQGNQENADTDGGPHRRASRSTSADDLERSKSPDLVTTAHRGASDGYRNPVPSARQYPERLGGGAGSESPFGGRKRKRKSTVGVGVGVIEGEVEGDILALVEEDPRSTKSKKSRISPPRSSHRSDVVQLHADDSGGSFFARQNEQRYAGDSIMGSDPGGGFPLSARSGTGFGGMMNPSSGYQPIQVSQHPPSAPPGIPLSHALSAYGQHAVGGGAYPLPAAQGRPGSVPGAAGMVIGYPSAQGCVPYAGVHPGSQHPHQQQPQQQQMSMPPMHGHPSTVQPGRPSHPLTYDLGMTPHPATGLDYSARTTSQDSVPTASATPYASSLAALLAVLPPLGTQQILYQTFFQDAFLAEGVTLLQAPFTDALRYLIHRWSTQQQQQQQQHPMSMSTFPAVEPFKSGDATTLALAFAILASALRVLPEESSQLLLSSVHPHAYPRGLDRVIQGKPAAPGEDKTTTPLHRRYMDHALLASVYADTEDTPSIMQVCFKLTCYRYARLCTREAGVNVSTGQVGKPRPREKTVAAGLALAQATKVAQAIKLHREREGVPTFERELGRRVFYALYTADRLHAFETSSPYMVQDHHTSTLIPSAISDSALYQSTTAGLSSALPQYDYKHGPSPVVHLVVTAQISRSMTPLLDTLAMYTAADISADAVDRYDAAFQACEDDLPSYYYLSPATDTSYDQQDPYLLFHRLDVHSLLYGLRMSLYRPKLNTYLSVKTPHSLRDKLSKLCYRTLRIQRSARIQEPKFAFRLFSVEKVFEAAFVLGFIARVELAYSAANRAQPHGSTPYPSASEESIEDMQQGLVDAIELLEGVSAWPDVGAFAMKTSKILRKIAKLLSASWDLENKRIDSHSGESVKSHPQTARVASWLKTWRSMDVEKLIADADYEAWNKVLRSMQA